MRILTNVNVDWLRWRWHTLVLSWILILAGIGVMLTGGVALGIDFTGGTLVVVEFAEPITEQAVRDALEGIPGDKSVQRYGDAADNQMMIRLPQTVAQEQGLELGAAAAEVIASLKQADVGGFEVLSTDIVGPVIGEDLQRRGIYATVAALFGIMLYIALRFRLSFGIGAMVASVHDVLITLSLLMFAGYEISLNVVAAFLTLVGYGVNDQIVIFDRVRENLRSNRRAPMNEMINRSVNQTLPRTVITAGTTALSLLALFLFGGEVLEPFAFTMLAGVVTSTYSTVFIASNIAVMLSDRKRSAAAAATAAGTPDAPARPGRKARRRAS